jgi:hypothetical protein
MILGSWGELIGHTMETPAMMGPGGLQLQLYKDFVERPMLDHLIANYGLEDQQDKDLATTMALARASEDESLPGLVRWTAGLANFQKHYIQNVKEGGRRLSEDSYISFSPDEGRWLTVSAETYERDILKDPYQERAGTQAGLFIGNALASIAPTVVDLAGGKGIGTATYFAMGFVGGANRKREYNERMGLERDVYGEVISGLGSAVIEMTIERFSLGKTRKLLRGAQRQAAARMGRAIETTASAGAAAGGAASKGLIRKAAESVGAVLPTSLKAGGKIAIVNALEESATQVSNNLFEILYYDSDYENSLIGTTNRIAQGVPAAALGGIVGGSPFAGVAAVQARSGEGMTRTAARETAMRIRKGLPAEGLSEITADRDEVPAPPPAAAAPAREGLAAPEGSSPQVAGVFAAKGPSELSAAANDARATREIPQTHERATSKEKFLSPEYAADIVENTPEFALALVEAAKGKGLPGRLMTLIYRGPGGRLKVADRALFIQNVRDAIKQSKKDRPIRRRTEQSLKEELREIGKKIKDGTATEADRKKSKSIQSELTRRKNAAEADRAEAVDAMEFEDEVEAELAAEEEAEIAAEEAAVEEERTKAPTPTRSPRATPPTARPKPKPEEEAEPAEEAAEEATEEPETPEEFRQVAREARDENKKLRAKQAKLVGKDGKIKKGKEEAWQSLERQIRENTEVANEAQDDARLLDIDNRIAKIEEEIELYPADDPGSVKVLERLRNESAELQEEYDEIMDKYETEVDEATDGLVEEEAEAEAEAETDPEPKGTLGVPDVLPAEAKGVWQSLIKRIGIIGQDTKGVPLDQLSEKQLLALAKREKVIPADKSMSKNQLIEAIIDLRAYRLGLQPSVVKRASAEALEAAFGPRRVGEKGKTMAKVVEMRRANKQIPETPAAIDEQLTGRRQKARTRSKEGIAKENKALGERAAKIVRTAFEIVTEEFGIQIIDPSTRQKVGVSNVTEVILEQIENWSDGWLGSISDPKSDNYIEDPDERAEITEFVNAEISRAREILELRREYKPAKGKKLTAKQKAEAKAVFEQKRQEAKRRAAAREANAAVNPGGIGVIIPKKKKPTKKQREQAEAERKEQERVSQEADRIAALKRVNEARKKAGLRPVKTLTVAKSTGKDAAFEELLVLSVDNAKPTSQERREFIVKLRENGIPIGKPGSKPQLIAALQRARNGEPIFPGDSKPVDLGKAQPIPEGKAEERQKRFMATKIGLMISNINQRLGRKRSRNIVTRKDNVQGAVDEAIESLREIDEGNTTHLKQILERIKRLESGDVRGQVQGGKRGRFRRKTKVWGTRTEDRIALLPKAEEVGDDPAVGIAEEEATFPRLTAAIQANMDPSVQENVVAPQTLSAIDKMFGTNFVERIRRGSSQSQMDSLRERRTRLLEEGKSTDRVDKRIAELEAERADIDQSPLAIALADDIAAILDDAALFGQNSAIADAVAVQQENGTVTIRLSTGEVVGRDTGSPADKAKSIQQTEEEIAFEERERELKIREALDLQRPDSVGASDPDTNFDDEYIAWSEGSGGAVIFPADEGGAEIAERVNLFYRAANMLARITGKIRRLDFNDWLYQTVRDVQQNYGGQQVSLNEAQSEINKAISTKKAKASGVKKGDLEAVPDDMANPAELAVIRRARRRGRRVILYRATNDNGVRFNGFVSSDPNTMYIRVGTLGPDIFSRIKDRRARRMIHREYERIMMQLIRHENYHLLEKDEKDGAEFQLLADRALDIATGHSYGDLFNDEESAVIHAVSVLGLSEDAARKLAKTKPGRSQIVEELRAEASSQIDLLRRAGGEGLYTDRNIVERTLDRVRRSLTRLGLRGEAAYQTLKMVEFETKVSLFDHAERAAKGKKRNKLMFSADMDIEGVPIIDNSSAQPMFSMDHFSREGLLGNDWTDFRERWQDRHVRLRKTMKELENTYGPISDEVNPLQLLDIAPGLVARKSQVFMDDVYTPIVTAMIGDNISMPEMGRYLHALHAKEVNAYLGTKDGGRDSGMTDTQADEIIAEIEARSDSALYDKYAKQIQDITRENLDLMLEAGLISKEDYDNIRDKYEFYVPLADPSHDKSIEDDGTEPISGVSQIGRQLLFRKGRDEDDNIMNLPEKEQNKFWEGILLHAATQRARVMRRAIRNDGLNRMVTLAMSLPGADNTFVVERGPRRKDNSVDIGKLRETQSGRSALVVRLNRDMMVAGTAYLKGEQIVVRSKDPRVTKVLNDRQKNLEEMMPRIGSVLSFVTRMKRALATRYNIEFTLVNPVRDVQEAIASLQSEDFQFVRRRLAKNLLPALKTTIKYAFSRGTQVNDPDYQEYLDSGGQQNFYRAQDADEIMRLVQRDIRKAKRSGQGIAIKSLRSPASAIRLAGRFLDNATNALDDSVRFAAWKIAKEEGYTTERATALSRDVTVDFSRRGATWGAWVNNIYAFSNVGTQGLEKLTRKKGKIFARVFAYGAINSLINSLAFDDEEWDDIPDYVKYTNYIIPLPMEDENGNRDFIKIPMPYGLGQVSALGMRVMEYFTRDNQSALGVATGALEDFAILNPLGYDSPIADDDTPAGDRIGFLRTTGILRTLLPDIADPIVSAATGYDWKGSPTWPTRYPGRIMSEVDRATTPELYKGVAKMVADLGGRKPGIRGGTMDYAPELYRFLALESLFGPAKMIERTFDLFAQFGNPMNEWNDYPIIRRFVDSPRQGSDNREAFWRLNDLVKEARALERVANEDGLRTIQEISSQTQFSEREIRQHAYLLYRSKNDKRLQFALRFRDKFNDMESDAREKSDYVTLEKIDKIRRQAYGYAAEVYDEIYGE